MKPIVPRTGLDRRRGARGSARDPRESPSGVAVGSHWSRTRARPGVRLTAMSWPHGRHTRDNRRAMVAALAGALLILIAASASVPAVAQERPVDLELVLAVSWLF